MFLEICLIGLASWAAKEVIHYELIEAKFKRLKAKSDNDKEQKIVLTEQDHRDIEREIEETISND